MQVDDLFAKRGPQREIEAGEGLVKKDQSRLAHERTADCDPLALAPRERTRAPRQQPVQPQEPRDPIDFGPRLGAGEAAPLSPKTRLP